MQWIRLRSWRCGSRSSRVFKTRGTFWFEIRRGLYATMDVFHTGRDLNRWSLLVHLRWGSSWAHWVKPALPADTPIHFMGERPDLDLTSLFCVYRVVAVFMGTSVATGQCVRLRDGFHSDASFLQRLWDAVAETARWRVVAVRGLRRTVCEHV